MVLAVCERMKYGVPEYSFSDEGIFGAVKQAGALVYMEFTVTAHSERDRHGRKKVKNMQRVRDAVESRLDREERYFGVAAVRDLSESNDTNFSIRVQYHEPTLLDALDKGRYPTHPHAGQDVQEYLRDLRVYARRQNIPLGALLVPGSRERLGRALGDRRTKYYHSMAGGFALEQYMREVLERCDGFCLATSANNLISTPERVGPDVDFMMAMNRRDVPNLFGNLRNYPGISLVTAQPDIVK